MSAEFDPHRTAVVFPGRSSRDEGMREIVEEWAPELLDALAAAVDGDDPFTEPDPTLATEQAVTVCCSLACWRALGRPLPRYLVGHSLGELSALVVAGSISDRDAIHLAATRGALMHAACDAEPASGMLAVGAPAFDVEEIAGECAVTVAHHNLPRQVVLAGSRQALERACALLEEREIRCTRLDARGAFNSPTMEPAVAPFRAALEECEVRPPHALVYSATSCRPLIDVRAELARNIASPVRWWETLARLAMQGVERFVEVRVGGLLLPLPAGIVTDRAPRPASPPNPEDLFLYRDERDLPHVLI